MIPGTNPPPAIWTFLKVYGSATAAPAGEPPVAACTATSAAAAHTAAAKPVATLAGKDLKRIRGLPEMGTTEWAPGGPLDIAATEHHICTGMPNSRRRIASNRVTYRRGSVNSWATRQTQPFTRPPASGANAGQVFEARAIMCGAVRPFPVRGPRVGRHPATPQRVHPDQRIHPDRPADTDRRAAPGQRRGADRPGDE